MRKKGDFRNFEHSMLVGVRWAGVSVFSPQPPVGFTESFQRENIQRAAVLQAKQRRSEENGRTA